MRRSTRWGRRGPTSACAERVGPTRDILPRHMSRVGVDSLVGRKLGSYAIEGLLGEGAMGAVYVATDLNLGREVAIKVVHGALRHDTLYCERFLREARASAKLNHPNIVQVYFAGTHERMPYLA